MPRRLCCACRYGPRAGGGQRHVAQQSGRPVEQFGHGGGDSSRGCGSGKPATRGSAHGRCTGHDVFSGKDGARVLAGRRHETNGSGTTHGGLHPQEVELRPSCHLLFTRGGILALALLDALIHHRTVGTGLPAIRPYFARFPHQRGTHDRGGDTHLVPRAHRARPRNPATHHRERPFPLWRRSGLCRRHRLGWHGWRTVCRSRGTHDGSGGSLKFKVQSSRPKTQKQAKLLSTPVLLNS